MTMGKRGQFWAHGVSGSKCGVGVLRAINAGPWQPRCAALTILALSLEMLSPGIVLAAVGEPADSERAADVEALQSQGTDDGRRVRELVTEAAPQAHRERTRAAEAKEALAEKPGRAASETGGDASEELPEVASGP